MNTPVKTAIDLPMAQIIDFCKRWKIVRMELFGSVLREDFRSDSDVDVMVTFAESVSHSMSLWFAMIDELEALFGYEVDFIERDSMEISENYLLQEIIFNSAVVIYGKE